MADYNLNVNDSIVFSESITTSLGSWRSFTSMDIDSYCGDDGSETLAEALTGADQWKHAVNETHWFILDLGASFEISRVRGRSSTFDDPTNVNIYVSDDKESFGDAVKIGITTWQDTDTFQEFATTKKTGRYIKVEITSTEDSVNTIRWGDGGKSIFEVFGYFINPLIVKKNESISLTELFSNGIRVSDDISISENLKFYGWIDVSDSISIDEYFNNGIYVYENIFITRSIFNEDCADISDWDDHDYGEGESSQITFDGKSCFKFFVDTLGGAASRYRKENSISTINDYILDINFYLEDLHKYSSGPHIDFQIQGINYRFYAYLLSLEEDTINKIRIYDDVDGNTDVSMTINKGSWYNIKFKVHDNQELVDIYLNNQFIQGNIKCKSSTAVAGRMYISSLFQFADTVTFYIDHFKISAGEGSLTTRHSCLFINVFDLVSITENISTWTSIYHLSLFESVSIVENVNALLPLLNISIYDSIIITEDVSKLIEIYYVSVNELISINENVSELITVLILYVDDSVSINEYFSSLFSHYNILVSDSISINESVNKFINILLLLSSDSISITENFPLLISYSLKLNETISVIDLEEEILPELETNIYDSIFLNESLIKSLPNLFITSFESISISENNLWNLVCNLFIHESVSITDTEEEIIQGLNIAIYDSIALSDFIAEKLPALPKYLFDSIGTIESITRNLVCYFNSFDSVAVSDEEGEILAELNLSIYESLSITEYTKRSLKCYFNSSDQVSINDTEEELISILYAYVNSQISITEYTERNLVCYFNSYDNVSITDIEEEITPTLYLYIFEAVIISDEEEETISILYKSVFELISITDVALRNLNSYASLQDEVSLSDYKDVFLPTLIKNISDSITVSDIEEEFRTPLRYRFRNMTEELDFYELTEEYVFANKT